MAPVSEHMAGAAAAPIPGPANREAFFAQQARYRRQTWRLTALCALAILLMGVPLSVVISPFVWSAAILAADLLNLIQPFPDVFQVAFGGIDRVLGSSHPPTTEAIVSLTAGLIVPGVLFMAGAWLLVRSLLGRGGTQGVALALGARAPRLDVLEEKQVVDIVEEMAIAAGVAPPRVQIVDVLGANAAAFGSSTDDAAIVVTAGLLATLDREETEGIVAHLVGSIGNGDLAASMAILSVVETLGLVALLIGAPIGRNARTAAARLLRLLFRRGAGRDEDAAHVRDLLVAGAEDLSDTPSPSGKARLRDVVELPFVMGQGAFWMNEKIFLWLLAGPLIAWWWRTRRYVADATAVQLTRHPDGLASALLRLSRVNVAVPGAGWSSHLFVVGKNTSADARRLAATGEERREVSMDLLRAAAAEAERREQRRQHGVKEPENPIESFVGFDPPLRRRLVHLSAAGATVPVPPASSRMPLKARVILAVILAPLAVFFYAVLFGVAVAMVYLALAIYMLFLLPMVGAAHVLLHRFLPQWLLARR